MTTPSPITKQVTLKTPIIQGDNEIKELTIRKPTAGDMRGLTLNDVLSGDVNAIIALAPRICSPVITNLDVTSMDLVDLTALQTGVLGFLVD